VKTEKLWFRVLPTDRQALERLAHIEGESMATVMRQLIREAARSRGILPNTDTNGVPLPLTAQDAARG
jgi:hypothetical protein